MFPVSGTGDKRAAPVIPQRPHPPVLPHPLDPHHERNIQYQLCAYLSEGGECYPEVDFGDGPLDLVWIDDSYRGRCGEDDHHRTVGIEVKRKPNVSTDDIREQLDRYVSSDAYPESDFVAGQEGLLRTTDISLLDGMWLAIAGDNLYNTAVPSGRLAYNRWTGQIKYDIDERCSSHLRRVPYHENAEPEALLGSLLWQHYRDKSDKLVTAEVKCAKPYNREIDESGLRFRTGESKRVDLVIGDDAVLNGSLTENEIVALELKAGKRINSMSRTIDQLTTYVESGLFSRVFLTVTRKLLQTDLGTLERIMEAVPAAGLREVNLQVNDGAPHISSHRISDRCPARRLEFERMPVVSYNGTSTEYFFADGT